MYYNECEVTVRYAETDQMGVVYHGNYFTWFEIGRTTLLKSIGYSYKELEDKDIMLPVIDVGCQYKESAKYDDVIVIKSTVKEMKGVRITFSYELYRKKDGRLLATGTTTHAFVDKSFKPISIKKKYPEFYQKLI
ncbi:acyl-CoA thioesterase [Alkaliphilus hydrothermalis]|uniref:Acyl-CoA thioester hydrolase n=1 Tax=Alkaliphilus hydrothermalis TaxID=1482730 RepID=A0ABS2NML7_9FIRM|nr:thioesterase family protein [Alkaliphilus hydrothermalis]MBM7614190.1 acyl-CoA thioester hydrolase [Alkaliphilus hydrothermalis]